MLSRFRSPLTILATLFVCVCLHEAGHAIAGLVTGGRILEFAVFAAPPHVRIAGEGSAAVEAVRDAAGTGFFLLLYAAFLAARPRWEDVRHGASLFACVELSGWTLSSLLGTGAMGPNDAGQFIAVTGTSPYLVAAGAAAIGLAGAMLVRRLDRRRAERPGMSRGSGLARGAASGI